jgi:hypothetical protein
MLKKEMLVAMLRECLERGEVKDIKADARTMSGEDEYMFFTVGIRVDPAQAQPAEDAALKTVCGIFYFDPADPFDAEALTSLLYIDPQKPDCPIGVPGMHGQIAKELSDFKRKAASEKAQTCQTERVVLTRNNSERAK